MKFGTLFFLSVLLGSFSLPVLGEVIESPVCNEKIYLHAKQLTFSDQGIYVLLEESSGLFSRTLVSQVNYDAAGLYVLVDQMPKAMERCPNWHPCTCPRCFGCNRNDCPYRCKCGRR